MRLRVGLLAVFAATLASSASLAAADSFTPVTLGIKVTPVARRQAQLPISVRVSADPGVLDNATTPLRIEVRLAAECGGSFETTTGTVLLNRALNPQPALGHAYSATISGSGRPTAFGGFTVCAFLEEQGNGHRMYANDTSNQVEVSPSCTAAASRFDAARRALGNADRQLRRAGKGSAARERAAKLVKTRTRKLGAARRAGTQACGAGVAL
jgi:hypothetical protein